MLKLDHLKLLGEALLHNLKGLWRYRVDKLRIICRIEEESLTVLVLEIGKRDAIYENKS